MCVCVYVRLCVCMCVCAGGEEWLERSSKTRTDCTARRRRGADVAEQVRVRGAISIAVLSVAALPFFSPSLPLPFLLNHHHHQSGVSLTCCAVPCRVVVPCSTSRQKYVWQSKVRCVAACVGATAACARCRARVPRRWRRSTSACNDTDVCVDCIVSHLLLLLYFCLCVVCCVLCVFLLLQGAVKATGTAVSSSGRRSSSRTRPSSGSAVRPLP